MLQITNAWKEVPSVEFGWIWKAILIVLAGTLLLRVAGRKSISQMTLAQTVIMIAIGSLLIQPVAGKNVWVTFGVGAVLILTLIVIEYVQVKFDGMENLITGKSIVLIENGTLKEKNLGKLRLTADQLEMQLRQSNVSKISDVEWATLEPNGRLGYTLKDNAQPLTKKDIQPIQDDIQQLQQTINTILPNESQLNEINGSQIAQLNNQMIQLNNQLIKSNGQDVFAEVDKKTHKNDPPEHMQ
jgi:uncharacterized membrane protein YcaP (DUF421 family)